MTPERASQVGGVNSFFPLYPPGTNGIHGPFPMKSGYVGYLLFLIFLENNLSCRSVEFRTKCHFGLQQVWSTAALKDKDGSSAHSVPPARKEGRKETVIPGSRIWIPERWYRGRSSPAYANCTTSNQQSSSFGYKMGRWGETGQDSRFPSAQQHTRQTAT